MEILSKRLKELRAEKKLTQTDVANKIFVKQSTYASYEIGRTLPSIEILSLLSKFYNVSTDYLIGNSNYKLTADTLSFTKSLDLSNKELLDIYEFNFDGAKLTNREKHKLIDLVKVLMEND